MCAATAFYCFWLLPLAFPVVHFFVCSTLVPIHFTITSNFSRLFTVVGSTGNMNLLHTMLPSFTEYHGLVLQTEQSLYRTAGNMTCKTVKFFQMFSLYASTFIVMAISIDRCMVISNPLPRFNQHSVVKCLMVGAWLSALLFSIPQVMPFN